MGREYRIPFFRFMRSEPPEIVVIMHPYRTHTCEALRVSDADSTVRLSGWVHRKRDHGGVIFIDVRDRYGLTEIVVNWV